MNSLSRILVKTFDIIIRPFTSQKQKTSLEKVKTILLIDCGLLGDTVLSFPAVASLRKRFPDATITALINPQFRELWKYNKDVDNFIEYKAPWLVYKHGLRWKDVKEWKTLKKQLQGKFDLAIDFRGDLRGLLFLLYPTKAPLRVSHDYSGKSLLTIAIPYPYKHESENNMAIALALGGKPEPHTYPIGKEESKKAKSFLLEAKKPVLFFPTAGYESKEWSNEKWVQLGKELEKEHTIVFASLPDDANVAEIKKELASLHFTGNLNEVAALIKSVDLVIGVDTGTMHLTAAVGTNSIELMGVTSPRRWKAYRRCTVIRKSKDVNDITVKDVLQATRL